MEAPADVVVVEPVVAEPVVQEMSVVAPECMQFGCGGSSSASPSPAERKHGCGACSKQYSGRRHSPKKHALRQYRTGPCSPVQYHKPATKKQHRKACPKKPCCPKKPRCPKKKPCCPKKKKSAAAACRKSRKGWW